MAWLALSTSFEYLSYGLNIDYLESSGSSATGQYQLSAALCAANNCSQSKTMNIKALYKFSNLLKKYFSLSLD